LVFALGSNIYPSPLVRYHLIAQRAIALLDALSKSAAIAEQQFYLIAIDSDPLPEEKRNICSTN